MEIARSKLGIFLEKIIEETKEIHRCPHSPLITVVSGICLADIWKRWGYTPDAVVCHSMGEPEDLIADLHQALN